MRCAGRGGACAEGDARGCVVDQRSSLCHDAGMSADLISMARSAAAKAYAPHSRFHVGCALRTEAGLVYTGCNVENASYGLTICAERNAIFHAVAEEGPGMRVATLAVVCEEQEFPPCGACRQVIAEFATPQTAVWFLKGGGPVAMTVADLLPSAFHLAG